MATTNLQIHETRSVTFGPVRESRTDGGETFFTREITILQGEHLEETVITLFGENKCHVAVEL